MCPCYYLSSFQVAGTRQTEGLETELVCKNELKQGKTWHKAPGSNSSANLMAGHSSWPSWSFVPLLSLKTDANSDVIFNNNRVRPIILLHTDPTHSSQLDMTQRPRSSKVFRLDRSFEDPVCSHWCPWTFNLDTQEFTHKTKRSKNPRSRVRSNLII